jgi:hypothetical protein
MADCATARQHRDDSQPCNLGDGTLTFDVFEIISFEAKITRQVSVNRLMMKKLRGWGGGSFQREFGERGSAGGEKDDEEVSFGRDVLEDFVHLCDRLASHPS